MAVYVTVVCVIPTLGASNWEKKWNKIWPYFSKNDQWCHISLESIQVDCNTLLQTTTKDVKILIHPVPGLEKLSSGKINTDTIFKKYQSRA